MFPPHRQAAAMSPPADAGLACLFAVFTLQPEDRVRPCEDACHLEVIGISSWQSNLCFRAANVPVRCSLLMCVFWGVSWKGMQGHEGQRGWITDALMCYGSSTPSLLLINTMFRRTTPVSAPATTPPPLRFDEHWITSWGLQRAALPSVLQTRDPICFTAIECLHDAWTLHTGRLEAFNRPL